MRKNKIIQFLMLSFIVSIFSISKMAWSKEKIHLVKTENVCMVTNMVFPKKQIPVEQDGKTYFGCCENCKQTLATDVASRFATDPVSGLKVDKANAVIAAKEDGSVIYFENKKNYLKFKK